MDPELEEAVRDRQTARAALDATPGSEQAKNRWVEAKRRAMKMEEEARARSFRTFATEELNRPANIGRVHKILRKMEGAVQAPPGQALGDHGRRAVEDRDKAEAFAKTYASVSRQVRDKFQDRRIKRELKERCKEGCRLRSRRKLKLRRTAVVQGSSTPSDEKRQNGHDVIGPAPNVKRLGLRGVPLPASRRNVTLSLSSRRNVNFPQTSIVSIVPAPACTEAKRSAHSSAIS